MKRVASRLTYRGGRRAAPYHYSPVDKGASEIRLMTLLPGVFGTKIRITIRTTVLSKTQVPEYEALSYTWGSAKKRACVYIQEAEGESTLGITQNLAEALQKLRYEDRPRTLWIDAICVDQSNIPERGHQVVRMANIYPQASRVIVWLGPERDNSALAMRELDALGSTIEINWDLVRIKPLSGDNYDQWSNEPLPFMKHGKMLASTLDHLNLPFTKDRKILASIGYFLDRSWFKRLWIWQEIRLARNGAQIFCGEKSMSWDTFRNAVMCLLIKRQLLPQDLAVGIQQVISICYYTGSLSDLESLLFSTRYAQCSDERDRIYAILNLSDNFKLEPDYSKTTEDVFKGVVLGYASTMKDLTVLRHCEMRENEEIRVPSWVPEWTTPNDCGRLYGTSACLGTKAQVRSDGENVLVVSGCVVATLDSIKQIIPPISFITSSTAQMGKIIRKLMRGKRVDELYVAGGFMIDALCRTLCGNSFAEGWLPPPPEFPKFHESKEYVRDLMNLRESIEPRGYVKQVIESVGARVFFLTKNGYIGLGPDSIKPEDQACVILGCRSPLILRPSDTKCYRVVGEALLGALRSNWRYVYRYFPDLSNSYNVLMDTQTGEVQVEDPRLGSLPAGWRIADHKYKHAYNRFSNEEIGIIATRSDPRLSPEALKAQGVNLQEIRLV